MNGPTRSSEYINIVVKITKNSVVLKSGGTTYEILQDTIYILPKELKEAGGAKWDPREKKYVILQRVGKAVIPVLVEDVMIPSELPLSIRYSGKAARKFIATLNDVLRKYHRGQAVLHLPLRDKLVFRLAVMLSRMAQLQSIVDV